MKKILLILIAIVVVGVATFFAVSGGPDSGRPSDDILNCTTSELNWVVGERTTYSNPDIGLEFTYQTGSDGYVLQERIPTDTSLIGPRHIIVLMRTEDAAVAPPQGGEGPPVMSI